MRRTVRLAGRVRAIIPSVAAARKAIVKAAFCKGDWVVAAVREDAIVEIVDAMERTRSLCITGRWIKVSSSTFAMWRTEAPNGPVVIGLRGLSGFRSATSSSMDAASGPAVDEAEQLGREPKPRVKLGNSHKGPRPSCVPRKNITSP